MLRQKPDGHRLSLRERLGALAQLGERLICIQEVRSSILLGSTTTLLLRILRDKEMMIGSSRTSADVFDRPIGRFDIV